MLSKKENWNELLNINDPNEATETLGSKINKIVELSTSDILRKIKSRKDWMTIGFPIHAIIKKIYIKCGK